MFGFTGFQVIQTSFTVEGSRNIGLWVINTTFNKSSVIMWWSVLLVKEIGVSGLPQVTDFISYSNMTSIKRHTRYYSISLYLAQVRYTTNLAVPCDSRCEIL